MNGTQIAGGSSLTRKREVNAYITHYKEQTINKVLEEIEE